MTFKWKESSDCFYYYKEEDGLIVGQVHKITHSEVYITKVIKVNEEFIVGRYINLDHAKAALARHWEIESRTLIEN